MEHILNDLIYSREIDKKRYDKLRKTKESKEYEEGLTESLRNLAKAGEKADIGLILDCEEFLLNQELDDYKEHNKSAIPSLESALKDMRSMQSTYSVIQNPEEYKNSLKIMNIKHTVRGLPKDGFHTAISSHITRLGNRLKELPLPDMETRFLKQRRRNLTIAKNRYFDRQREVLGPPQEQDMEI